MFGLRNQGRYILIFSALIFGIFGFLSVSKSILDLDKKTRPAKISVTRIMIPECADCFSLDRAVEDLSKYNVKIKEDQSVAYNSEEGKKLIQDLNIKRVPTYILTGDINSSNLTNTLSANGVKVNKTFVYTKVGTVFLDLETQKYRGRINVTYINDDECTQCLDLRRTIGSYRQKMNLVVSDEKGVLWNSREGQVLIKQYKITKIPTFILTGDMDAYEELIKFWHIYELGTVEKTPEKEDAYVARKLYPPWRDLAKNKLIGLVHAIYLIDSACKDCYDPKNVHGNALTTAFRVMFSKEEVIDIHSQYGKSLVSKYKIKSVPTVLLSPSANEYKSLQEAWPSIGTTEKDGWYVFRDIAKLKENVKDLIYKDLK